MTFHPFVRAVSKRRMSLLDQSLTWNKSAARRRGAPWKGMLAEYDLMTLATQINICNTQGYNPTATKGA